MTITTSTIDDLIRTHNPFAGHTVVRAPQIWGKSFPDVPLINAHASNAVFEAIERVRQGERQVVGITLTADKGLGKSHIISRIRHRLQAEDDALFIYMSKYDNLNQIKYQFLQTLSSSLRAAGNQGVMQWQELATALINEAKNWSYTPQQYISIFPSWLRKYSNKVVDHLTDNVIQLKPNIHNPYIVKAILWRLSSVHAIYATHWISAWELAPPQAEAMGLPNLEKEERETEVLNTICQILDLTSDYKVPVICFDELDIADADEKGFTSAQVVASLGKELYNNIKRGVLLLAMYPETWRDQVKTLPQAQAVIDRIVSDQTDRQPIVLNYLNSDDVVAVVSQWLKEFAEENQQTPPHPLYPFNENKLRELGRQKPTVRSVLNWCAEHFVVPETRIAPVEAAFQNELAAVEESIESCLEDKAAIADTLWLGFSTLVGETVAGITVKKIVEIEPSSANQGYIDFKIVGKENGKEVKIGVAIVQQSGGKYVGAALKRLIDYRQFDLTRGCLVRSKKINPGASVAKECVRKLLKEQVGEWLVLHTQEIKPLLAIFLIHNKREKYELSEETIFGFIKQKKLTINNPLIQAILSEPSGQEPENLID